MPADLNVTLDAYDLARTWLAVAIAQSTDDARPALCRTTLVSWYPDGLRLVSTDSYVLLRGWVPYPHAKETREPALHRRPLGEVVVSDPDGRGVDLLKYLRTSTKGQPEGKAEPIQVVASTITVDDQAQGTLDGLSPTRFVLEVPGQERLVLPTYDGDFPAWRRLFEQHQPAPVDRVSFGPSGVLRLGALSKLYGHVPLHLTFAGDRGPILVDLDDPSITVRGLAMPVAPPGPNPDAPPPYPGAVKLDADGERVVEVDLGGEVGVVEITTARSRRRKDPK